MDITWLGHATFLIEHLHYRIFIDPYAGDPENYTGKADCICITHEHFDHFSKELISRIRGDETVLLAAKSVANQLDGALALVPGQAWSSDWCKVTAVQAYNTDKPHHPKGLGIGILIEIDGKTIYHAGDTDMIEEMRDLKPDIALLPIGGTYTMNAEQAAKACDLLKCKLAIPMHYGSVVGTEDDAATFMDLAPCETKQLIIGEKTKF